MKVSAIMTVKNGENFIEQAMQSVLLQSYPVCEVVIVDDGSTDRTVEVLKKITGSTRIPIRILTTSGVGRARALNMAVNASVGDWIANLDVDDFWYPDKLRLQMQAAEQYSDYEIFITGSRIIYGAEDIVVKENFATANTVFLRERDFYINNPVNHSSVVISRKLLLSIGSYDERLMRQIDADLWTRLLQAGHKFAKVDQPLTVKRLHENQSFERSDKYSYARGAMLTSYRKLSALRAPFYFFFIPLLKFIYQILPRGIGDGIRKTFRPNV